MRVGLFVHPSDVVVSIKELTALLGDELVGYSSPLPLAQLSKNIYFEPHPAELLACCDTAIMLSNNVIFDEIPRMALRRGVNVFFFDITKYSLNFLNDINLIAKEIGAKVGFGFSGIKISGELFNKNPVSGISYVNITRNLKKGTSISEFSKSIVFDMATMVRFKGFTTKKNQSLVLPLSNDEFNFIHLSLEMCNGSIIGYTASRLSESNSLEILLHTDTARIETADLSLRENYSNIFESPFSPLPFIDSIRNGSEMDFTIDQAIQTLSLFESITKKHFCYC